MTHSSHGKGAKRLLLAASALVLATPNLTSAHGYLTSPMARQAYCAAQGGYWWPADGSNIPNAACREAFLRSGHYPFTQQPEFSALTADFYNQQAVEQSVPDGTLCAAGHSLKSGMDLPSPYWQRTEVTPNANGQIKVRFLAETPHNPSFWQFYLSKPGFDSATTTLKWADLELVAAHGNIDFIKDPDGRRFYEMYVTIPADRQGDALLYSRWQRVDPAGEGFYNCADITIKRTGDTNDQWSAAGYFIKQGQTANIGDIVSFRLFSASGDELFTQALKVTQENLSQWQKDLATTLVLDNSHLLRIGVKNTQGDIAFDEADIPANQVWLGSAEQTYQLSITPNTGNTAPTVHELPDLSVPEQSINQIHVHAFDDENDPLSYQWTVPADFTYSVDGANLSLVAPSVTQDTAFTLSVAVSDGKLTTQRPFKVTVTNLAAAAWDKAKVYVGGDSVSHNGKHYQAKWWTLGEEPGKALVWKEI